MCNNISCHGTNIKILDQLKIQYNSLVPFGPLILNIKFKFKLKSKFKFLNLNSASTHQPFNRPVHPALVNEAVKLSLLLAI